MFKQLIIDLRSLKSTYDFTMSELKKSSHQQAYLIKNYNGILLTFGETSRLLGEYCNVSTCNIDTLEATALFCDIVKYLKSILEIAAQVKGQNLLEEIAERSKGLCGSIDRTFNGKSVRTVSRSEA